VTTRIAIVSAKGGVGKTTLALNLGLAFAEHGRSTLLVDLDPQGGIGHSLGKADQGLLGLADLMQGKAKPSDVVIATKQAGFGILPRGRLSPVHAPDFETGLRAPGVLARALAQVEQSYELVLLDTPSGLGIPTRGALAVADWVLLPVQAEPLALRSLMQALQVIDHVAKGENPKLKPLGIVATMVEKSHDPSMGVVSDLWGHFAGVVETMIPRAEVFALASASGLPVSYLGGRPSPETRRFDLLAVELEALLARAAPGTGGADAIKPRRQLV
jgi:chromosome partitioning protein